MKLNGQEDLIIGAHDGAGDEKQSLNDTMESIVQQLIRNDTVECVDAYQTLAAAVKVYDELPDLTILKSRLHQITKAIKQHLCVLDQSEPQPAEINLVTSALKVLVILVWNSDFSPLLADDFRIFALDKAISTVAEHRAPKSVVVHYLHFLATQEFRSALLTSNRATRLIEALSTLSDHIKGNGIVSERLLVYSRLLDQGRAVMRSKAGLWVEHMLSAMVSSIPDTRSKALALGRKACQCFASTASISTIVRAVLDDVQDDGKTKGATMCKKLEKMIIGKDHDQADHVPQIWAVIILLSNSAAESVSEWVGFRDWLMVIQRCFNSSDSNLRTQANLAWNRFVYVARPQQASDQLLSMLMKPILAQLDRPATDKRNKSSHSTAVSSYCNLLYYAFRPATSAIRLTKAWNEYIVKVMRSAFFEKNPANADIACRILMSLFWNNKPGQKVWNENRAHESRTCDPEELPTIDCKWVRSKAGPITDLFAVLFRYSSWGFVSSADQAYVSKAWRSFIKSVRSASGKEIKMSTESRSSTLAILAFLEALHNPRDDKLGDLSSLIATNITHIAITELQLAHVVEALEHSPTACSPAILNIVLEELRAKAQQTSSIASKQDLDTVLRFLDVCNDSLVHTYEDKNVDTAPNATLDLLVGISSLMLQMDVEPSILRMQAALSLWLKDERGLVAVSYLTRFTDNFVKVLGQIKPTSVLQLDSLFAATFGSTHRTVVSSMARTWNDCFGESNDLQLGERLIETLQRLRPYVELRMPAGCIDSWSELRESLPAYNTQDESVPKSPQERNDLEEEVFRTKEYREGKQPEETNAAHPSPKVASHGPKPPHRHRYDDSQVEFVAVQSSPDAAPETQYLTERQREVRDRQRTETAVVFADLRSSPRLPSRATSEVRDCGFARKAANLADRPSTPPLPDHVDDAEIQPSPTPKSRCLRNAADVEIPSSPPSLHGNAEKHTPAERCEVSPQPDDINDDPAALDLEMPDAPQKGESVLEPAEDSNDHGKRVESAANELETGATAESGALLKSHEACATGTTDDPEPDHENQVMQQESSDADVSVIEPTAAQPPTENAEQSGDQPWEGIIDAEDVIDHCAGQNSEARTTEEATDLPTILDDEASSGPAPPALEASQNGQDMPHRPMPAPETPKRASSRIDTDDLEQMSASQLSHDLDWSMVFEGLDQTPASLRREKSRTTQELALSSVQSTKQSTGGRRKRKAANSLWSRSKKAKKATRGGSQTAESQESFVKMEEDDDDLYDMIEVQTSSDAIIPSSPPRADAEGDTFVDAPESQVSQPRKRGRPRKSRSVRSKAVHAEDNPSEASHHQRGRRSIYSQESTPEARRQQIMITEEPAELIDMTEADVVDVMETDGPTYTEQALPEETSEVAPVSREATGASLAEQQQRSDVREAMDQAVQTPVDVLASLQQILDQVKNAVPGSVDLRAVDELCFQIRFQAQLKSAV